MSQKGSIKSNNSGLRNSFGILSTLDDHVDASKASKKKAAAASAAANGSAGSPAGSVPKAAPVKQESRPVEKVKTANAAPVQQQKKQEVKHEVKKVFERAEKSGVQTSESNAAPLMKMLVFAILMLFLPVGAYYWSVNQAGLDLGEIKSALIAVLVVNALLFVYILMAFLEESKQNKIKKN